MDAEDPTDIAAAGIAAAISEPARARMLYALLDGRALTATELSVIANVSPSTASVHLNRLKAAKLVSLEAQGRHRYFRLASSDVAGLLERLSVLAGASDPRFIPKTPNRLRDARTCYDHLAGALGVEVHDRLFALGWLCRPQRRGANTYDVTAAGAEGFARLGIEVAALQKQRRHFASSCLDWSERKPHLAGALGAALLKIFVDRRWVVLELDSRALSLTALGRTELQARFGLRRSGSPAGGLG